MSEEKSKPSLGVRVTIFFLRVFCIAMFVPVLIGCVAAGTGLLMGNNLASDALLFSGAAVGGFLASLMTALGSDWLARHLKATSTGTEESTRVRLPIHPARRIFLPPLGSLVVYAFLAVLVWLPSISQASPARTWPWPVAWIAIGCGAMYLLHILDEKLP